MEWNGMEWNGSDGSSTPGSGEPVPPEAPRARANSSWTTMPPKPWYERPLGGASS